MDVAELSQPLLHVYGSHLDQTTIGYSGDIDRTPPLRTSGSTGDVNPKWPHRDGLKWPR